MFSTMTKILAAATATSAIATGFSVYHDYKVTDIQAIPDGVEDAVSDTPTEEAAAEILNSAE